MTLLKGATNMGPLTITLLPFAQLTTEIVQSEILMPLSELWHSTELFQPTFIALCRPLLVTQ